jgi:thymidylate synthase ThyX
MPITVLVSATNFGNWFHLRDHKDAQPELQVIATEMHYQYLETTPRKLYAGEWHLPYIREEDRSDETLLLAIEEHRVTGQVVSSDDILRKVSVGRCARVSYLTHEGIRDLRQDISLHDKLAATTQTEDPGHFSPFEHPAQALARPERIGNFVGFRQYRKDFANEAGPEFVA